ncbi:cytoplasmic 60S subunit biogenesis factor REI1 homolog 1-like [Panicum virgatum]|uniref:C2H2-type domain-containing protein n=1 Tax=Panicum virgatum TaxID=38727 RepID=A0A8T0TD71_PANVG|nr:cytoplasmic 60S subunit biogenesis factor REI1 homolog 1-like [Panicum virgatum]KAG2608187.1 hypothetical protein PVAP13_4NG283900 [Panicum virgatum]
MATANCNACNVRFVDDEQKRLHYRSDWHCFNLKRKVAGVPGVTEALFLALQAALGEGSELTGTPILYGCALCGKEYRSSRAHAQHLSSRSHLMRASDEEGPDSSIAGITVVKLKPPAERRGPAAMEEDEELAGDSAPDIQVDEDPSKCDEEPEELDPLLCFMCDLKHDTVEDCMVHMHRKHGFFIPDSEYLKDPHGLLIHVGLKVKRDFICLYCNDRRQPFQSLEAVRKHMDAKGHCKLRYGDGGEDEDADLEDFYDYCRSYTDVEGKQLVAAGDVNNNIELGIGGSELVITNKTGKGTRVRALGSREFTRYYRQKPRPSAVTKCALALSLASSYKEHGFGDSSV